VCLTKRNLHHDKRQKMMEDSSRKIICLYFGKHFSNRAKKLFGLWLMGKNAARQKEKILHELWDGANAQVEEDTQEDWSKIQKHLCFVSKRKEQKGINRQFYKYASVVVLMVMSAIIASFLTHKTIIIHKTAEMTEFFVPYGESKELILPDSSKVWVDAGSVLIYPKNFEGENTRSIYLNGKASFKVKKNRLKPFIVKTNCLNIRALGTVFTVNSYPSDLYTIAILEKGSIQISVNGGYLQPSVLEPDQQYIYSNKKHTATIQTVDTRLYAMERQGFLIFECASFDQLMSSLERKFNVVIQYNSQKYGKGYYNVKFGPKESIRDVMRIIQELIGVQYTIRGNVIIIN
jgi:ferric-dicitrate binding protein FerR (iron transport regulator)